MSIDATKWAWTFKDISPIQKMVLLALANEASHYTCTISINEISRRTCSTPTTVIKALEILERRGIIVRLNRKTQCTGFSLLRED